jgi:soluble lytic murein transglycosylase-like protein
MNTTFLVASRAYSTVKGALAIIGLAALAAFVVIPGPREALLENLPPLTALSVGDSFAGATVSGGQIQAAELPLEQRAVTEYISKRYRVADEAVAGFVATAYKAGGQHSVDPLLLLAVMAVESRYNPVAESSVGAKGLMQIIPKYHLEKLLDHGGEDALLDPEVNIMVGARILREYQRRLGDTEAALQMYAGAFDEPTSTYANKVLAEKARLEVLRQKAKKQSA